MIHLRSLILVGLLVGTMFMIGPTDVKGIENHSLFIKNPLSGDLDLLENKGQLDRDDILFYTTGSTRYAIGDGFIQAFRNEDNGMISSLRMDLIGSDMDELIYGPSEDTAYNFFYGSSPEGWTTKVHSYEWVIMKEIYNGIDMKVYPSGFGIKYDLIVHPDGDPSDIIMSYSGEDRIEIQSGRTIKAYCGGIELTDGPLLVYQEDGSIIPSQYKEDEGCISVHLEEYDRVQDLVIDPLLLASTYLGGNDWDKSQRVAVDALGRPYVAQTVDSSNFPTTPGAYKRIYSDQTDIVVSRMSEDLSVLQVSTYIGGNGYDRLGDIDIADDGRIFICGSTNSSGFPATSGSYIDSAPIYKNGFVTSFTSDLSSLDYSTFIGGSAEETAADIAIDPSGNAYVTGTTFSSDFPTTSGSYKEAKSGNSDCFIVKLGPNGDSSIYSTFIGGPSFGEEAYTIVVDDQGYATIAGNSIGGDYPTTNNSYMNGSSYYASFLTRFELDGSDLDFSTYVANATWTYSMSLGPNNDYFLTGITRNDAGDFPVTENAHDRSISGDEDAFFSRISNDGTRNLHTTFLGGNEKQGNPPNQEYVEAGLDIRADGDGRAYICGHTDASGFPVTIGAYDRTRNNQDCFLTIIAPDTGEIEYSTFIGGGEDDEITGIALNSSGGLFAGGNTYSNYPSHNFPVTADAYDTTFNSGYDGFLIRFKLDSYVPTEPLDLEQFPGDSFVNLSWNIPESDGGEPILGYLISRGTNINSLSNIGSTGPQDLYYNDTTPINGIDYIYRIRAYNDVGSGPGSDIEAYSSSSPGAPRGLMARTGNHFINLTWAKPYDDGGIPEMNYTVLIGMRPDDLFIAAEGIENDFYNITGLDNGARYYLSVIAVNIRGEGPPSDIIEVVPLDVPSEPLSPIYTLTPFQVHLDWTEPEENGGSENLTYTIYAGPNMSSIDERLSNINTTEASVPESRIGMNILYFIRARNEQGKGPISDILNIIPFGDMSAPQDLVALEMGTHIDLDWEPPELSGGAVELHYDLFYGYNTSDMRSRIDNINGSSYRFFDVEPGRHYYFKVRANNTHFTGPFSDITDTVPYMEPSSPLNLTAVHGSKLVFLEWEEPSFLGGDLNISYEVYRGTDPILISPWRTVSSKNITIRNLKNGVYYYFAVSAKNIKGESNRSNVVSERPMGLPSEPRELHYTEGNGFLNISWEEPVDDGGSDNITYGLYFGESNDDIPLAIDRIRKKNVNMTDLINGRTYFIYLTALNEEGVSDPTDTIQAVPMTFPLIPENINLSYDGTGIKVLWDPPLEDGGGEVWFYHIYRGSSSEDMVLIDTLQGSSGSYLDQDVEEGSIYYYSISAETPYGRGERSAPVKITAEKDVVSEDAFDPLVLMIAGASITALLLIIIVFLLIKRGRRKRAERMFFEE